MKNIYSYLLWFMLLVMSSCNQDYLNEYMVEDKIYLNEAGLNTPTIFNWGTYTYDLYVIKGGKGGQGAKVRLVVDETVLSDYNKTNGTSYKMMPKGGYVLKDAELSFGKEDYRKAFKIDFNPETILLWNAEAEKQYVLPCRMEIIDNSIAIADEEKMSVILYPNVSEPYLKFSNSGLMSPRTSFVPSSDDEFLFYTKVQTNYYNQWDMTYTLEVDPKALDVYNKENKTDYKLLPETAYEFNQSFWKIPAKWDEQYVEIKLKKSGLISDGGDNLFGKYVLPIRIASVSMHKIDPDADLLLYVVTFENND